MRRRICTACDEPNAVEVKRCRSCGAELELQCEVLALRARVAELESVVTKVHGALGHVPSPAAGPSSDAIELLVEIREMLMRLAVKAGAR